MSALPDESLAQVATETPLAESVAKLVSVTQFIGRARDVLEDAGHTTSITGNKITVDDMVIAHYVGGANPRWVVWSIAGSPPTWVIGVAVS
jgi:hypothetical protein